MRLDGHDFKVGHPYIYRRKNGRWTSLTWTNDLQQKRIVPQMCTNHLTWDDAMLRVWRWYRNGKSGTW